MKKIIKETTYITIFTIFIWLIYKGHLNFSFLSRISSSESFNETVTEIFFTILLIPLSYLLFVLVRYVIKLEKTVGAINTIPSRKLKEESIEYVTVSAEKIANKFNTMLTGQRTKNVLWELEQLELAELEIEFNKLKIDDSLSEDQKKLIRQIKDNIYKFRRNRITRIANRLIYNGNSKNIFYYTTETKRPSEIDVDKNQFRDEQIRILKKFKPKEVRRILILNKTDYSDEIINHRKSLEEFIKWNNSNYDDDKKILLNFIIYDDSIKLDDIFYHKLNDFYDFALSKYGNKKLVFAQKDDMLTIFDSENLSNKSEILKFDKNYERFIDTFKNIRNNSIGIKKNKIYYSKVIESIEEAEKFLEFINK